MAVLSALLALMTIWEEQLPAEFAGVFAAAAVLVAAAVILLANTVCKKR